MTPSRHHGLRLRASTLAVCLSIALPASASTILVNSTTDAVDATPGDGVCATAEGVCTLRAAVQEANALPGDDTVQLPAGLFGLTLQGAGEDAAATGDLDVLDPSYGRLDIVGAGAALTVIDGNYIDRVLDIRGSPEVSLLSLTIRHGSVSAAGEFGAGILASSDIVVRDVAIEENAGAGIDSVGYLTIERATVQRNVGPGVNQGCCNGLTVSDSTISDNGGAGISHPVPTAGTEIKRCVISRNKGGGLIGGKTTNVEDSLIEGNSTPGDGGGIGSIETLGVTRSRIVGNSAGGSGGGVFSSLSFQPGARGVSFVNVYISDSVVSGNTAEVDGGGIWSRWGLQLSRSTVDGNMSSRDGGGLFIDAGTAVGLSLNDSSITNNLAHRDGGGLWTARYSPGWLVNVTVSGNQADRDGGGIYQTAYGADVYLANATIVANTADADGDGSGDGGGVLVTSFGGLTTANSIIASNVDRGGESPDCAGTVLSGGYNLIQSTVGCTIDGVATGNILGADPGLGALADNGGGSLTHQLRAGSPAINAGNFAGCTDPDGVSLATDQRGIPRPWFGRCDIGAYELGDAPATTTTSSSTSTSTSTSSSTSSSTSTTTTTQPPPPTTTTTVAVPTTSSTSTTTTTEPPPPTTSTTLLIPTTSTSSSTTSTTETSLPTTTSSSSTSSTSIPVVTTSTTLPCAVTGYRGVLCELDRVSPATVCAPETVALPLQLFLVAGTNTVRGLLQSAELQQLGGSNRKAVDRLVQRVNRNLSKAVKRTASASRKRGRKPPRISKDCQQQIDNWIGGVRTRLTELRAP